MALRGCLLTGCVVFGTSGEALEATLMLVSPCGPALAGKYQIPVGIIGIKCGPISLSVSVELPLNVCIWILLTQP